MRLMTAIFLTILLLSGCSVAEDPETMLDVYDAPVSTVNWELSVTLPEGTAQEVMESGNGGRYYDCDGFSVAVCTLSGGDLSRSIFELTGFDKNALTVMHTVQDGAKRYDCAWSTMGEGTEQICRTVILDDGYDHHAVTVMCDYERAGVMAGEIETVLSSVKLVNID